jgi:hypothetical protein
VNGFEKHKYAFVSNKNKDIHLSPSTLNLWVSAPDIFVIEKLFKKRGPMSPAAWRGCCVEDAVVRVLKGDSVEESVRLAHRQFKQRFILGDEKVTKELGNIGPMTELAVQNLKEYGEPEFPEQGGQNRIELKCRTDEWTVPFIGYLDLYYPKHGLVIDLKTTARMPGTQSMEHQVQRAIYAKAMKNHAVKFLYVTPKKTELREDGDVGDILNYVKLQTKRLERFLSMGEKEELAAVVPFNPGHPFWGGLEGPRAELYGM